MPRRRHRRRIDKAHRHAQPPRRRGEVAREATRVERLAYTRSQAAEALGISRSTFARRVLPLIETIDMPWGARLVPVDELERLVAERRQPAEGRPVPQRRGRPATVSREVANRILAEHETGLSFGQIARRLEADGVRPAQGGRRWWPSTVRSILLRTG